MTHYPACGFCHKTMTPSNATIAPELFLCDDCVLAPKDKEVTEALQSYLRAQSKPQPPTAIADNQRRCPTCGQYLP